MNSRSSVNEKNLVNLSTDLQSLNKLDTKESLLSFPFDHLYACHSESSDRRQPIQLDKEVEISTHSVVDQEKGSATNSGPEINRLTERLSVAENQNKKLKDLLIYHLDLIQQQNDLITKKEKQYQALKQENDTLKFHKVNQKEKKVTINQRQPVNPVPAVHVPTSTVIKSEPGTSSQVMFNSLTELLLPDRPNPYIFDNDVGTSKHFGQDPYGLTRASETSVPNYLPGDLSVSSILDGKLNCDNFTMIENKRSFIKKEIKTEPRPDPLYTVTSNSGNPVIQKIQRNRRKTSGIGSLSRMPKTPIKVELPESTKMFDDEKSSDRFSLNKKSKMINTYGKSRTTIPKRTSQFTGSLSDRLQLIDTTPTGEDPYQLGEADMREQSPIPKLMLQKSNHGRMKYNTDTLGEGATHGRRIYDTKPAETATKASSKMKLDRYSMSSTFTNAEVKKEIPKTVIVEEPDLDIVKTEPEIDWRLYTTGKQTNESSFCDWDNPNNILPTLDATEFQDLFTGESGLNLDTLNKVDYSTADKNPNDMSKRRGARTTSLVGPNLMGDEAMDNKRGNDSKRGRKRAMSAAGLTKGAKQNAPKAPALPKPKTPRGKAACRGKKSPVPGMVTKKPYHTHVGDPDLSWYLGLDPDVKMEDVDPPTESKVSTVEVPRWREKPYTSSYTLEGTENLDDKVFEKRHQKLEAEERRQLRWHMRRIREQRHVERLRQRHRDPWSSGNASLAYQPSVYTIWPQPQRDAMLIEITDTLPVMAFGEILPDLPPANFVLPWVRTSKALKRSKRSKTLH